MTRLTDFPRNPDGSPMPVEAFMMLGPDGQFPSRLLAPLQTPDGARVPTRAIAFLNEAGSVISLPTTQVISVSDMAGAVIDGVSDDTSAVQAAVMLLPFGGTILFSVPGTYRISMASILYRNINVVLAPGVILKKYGDAGVSSRTMFFVPNLLDANFNVYLNGGIIDLNGEGPRGIGVAGRIANTYTPLTITEVKCINGPANSALYGLRSSGLRMYGPGTLKNSGESGILWRNCGSTEIIDVNFENLASFGVEFNLKASDADGGTGTMPARDHCYVRRCRFSYIDDLGMGSGSGVGIGGGGDADLGDMEDYEFTDNSFDSCLADIQMEFPHGGTRLNGWTIDGVFSKNAGVRSVSIIGAAKGGMNNFKIINPGKPGACAIVYRLMLAGTNPDPNYPSYPSVAGVYVSNDFEDVTLGDNIKVHDERTLGTKYGADGVTVLLDNTFTSASIDFTGFAGADIEIYGAGPSGALHQTTIASVNSAHSIELTDLPRVALAGTAKFAIGGHTREGVVASNGDSIDIGKIKVQAGCTSGLLNEPLAALVRIQNIDVFARLGEYELYGPSNGTARPCGLRVVVDLTSGQTFDGKVLRCTKTPIVGVDAAEIGTFTNRLRMIPPVKYLPTVDRVISPGAITTNYGDPDDLTPTAPMPYFAAFKGGSLEAVGTFGGGETLTFKIQLIYADSDGVAVEITYAAAGVYQLTAKQLQQINPDGNPFRLVFVWVKSSAVSSTLTGKINLACAY